MTDDLASFERCAEMVRRMKRELVATWEPGDPDEKVDLVPFVSALRGGRIVGNVYPPHGNTGAREASYVAALMLRADEIFVLSDSLCRTYEKGQEPDPASLQAGELGRRWAAGDREGISECIMAVRITPEGPQQLYQWRYERRGNVTWWNRAEDEEPRGNADSIQGAVVDYALQGFAKAAEAWPELMAGIETNLPAGEDREATTDRACAQFASETFGCVVLIFEEDDVRVYAEGREAPELLLQVPH